MENDYFVALYSAEISASERARLYMRTSSYVVSEDQSHTCHSRLYHHIYQVGTGVILDQIYFPSKNKESFLSSFLKVTATCTQVSELCGGETMLGLAISVGKIISVAISPLPVR